MPAGGDRFPGRLGEPPRSLAFLNPRRRLVSSDPGHGTCAARVLRTVDCMADTIARFVSAVLLTMAALLPIINSPGLAPIFLSMTPGATDAARAALAGRIARNSF